MHMQCFQWLDHFQAHGILLILLAAVHVLFK